jgi:hypothetical protein
MFSFNLASAYLGGLFRQGSPVWQVHQQHTQIAVGVANRGLRDQGVDRSRVWKGQD